MNKWIMFNSLRIALLYYNIFEMESTRRKSVDRKEEESKINVGNDLFAVKDFLLHISTSRSNIFHFGLT